MSICYVTIKSAEESGYKITLMTCPKIEDEKVTLSVSRNTIAYCVNQETAEVAAKKLAALRHLSYVPENSSIITSLPINNSGFLALELTPDGKVIGQGSVISRAASAAKAKQVAQMRGLPLLLPR